MSDQSVLQIDTDEELARVMRQLKTLPQQLGAPNVLKNALNSTARKVRRQIIKDSKGRYALKEKKALQSESKILSASASTLEAAVLAKGPMRDIMDFMTQPNTDTAAAAAKVLNSGAMKPLEAGGLKAFITTFRSGHTAIVQRRGLPCKHIYKLALARGYSPDAFYASRSDVVWYADGCRVYHSDPNCRGLRKRYSRRTTVALAEYQGLRPCKTCCNK